MANDKTYDRHINIWINGKEVNNNISSIRKEMYNLTNEVGRATRGSEEYNQKVAELKRVKQILKDHQDSISATGGAWNKVKGLFSSAQGLFVAGFAGLTVAYQSLKGVIFSTDALGDKFEKTIGGLKGGLNALETSLASINQGGLKNLAKNIREGIAEGQRYAESLDNIDESTRALQIAEAKANNEILRQTEISRSAKYSKEQQIAAGKKIIEIEEQLTKIREGIAHQAYLNESQNIQSITHLTESEILAYATSRNELAANMDVDKDYIKMVADKIAKGKEYNDDLAKYNQLYRNTITATGQYTIMTKDQAAEYVNLGNKIKGASEETKHYALAIAKMPGDDKMKLLTDAFNAYQVAIGSGLENTMKTRVRTAKNEEQLDKESLKRKQDDIDLQVLGDKLADEYFDDEQKHNQKELADIELMEKWTQEYFDNEQRRNKKSLADKELMEKWTDEYFKKEYGREITDLENLMIIKGNNALAVIDLEKKKNDKLRLQEIDAAENTGASIQLINEKYAKLDKDLDEKKKQTKLQLAAEFFSNVASIAGKQTAVGKAAAIAETTINTYASATASYNALAGIPIIGPVLGFAAAAAAVVAGLANVKNIMKVKTGDTGYSLGGFTGPGGKNETAGIVHRGEYVVPSWMINKPDFKGIIEGLEYARVNGTPGYANGGFVGSGAPGSRSGLPAVAMIGSDPELKALIRENIRINKILARDGVHTNFTYDSVNKIRKGMRTIEDIENNVSY
jgi:hypothetical protein